MKFALTGYPLGHSMSPFIHNELFRLAGVEAEYEKLELPPEKLNREAFSGLSGFNVTIPHKIAVIPLLDEVQGIAAKMKTVNTVKNDNGKLIGYNTDYDGMLYSLGRSGIELSGNVLLCGCGGVARMMAHAALQHGCRLTVCAVDEKMAADFKQSFDFEYGIDLKVIGHDVDTNETYDLLINGTPAGMYPKLIGQLPTNKKLVESASAVLDAVYNPRETALTKLASANGAKVAYGMPMLVYQAARAQAIWYGAQFSDDDLDRLTEMTDRKMREEF